MYDYCAKFSQFLASLLGIKGCSTLFSLRRNNLEKSQSDRRNKRRNKAFKIEPGQKGSPNSLKKAAFEVSLFLGKARGSGFQLAGGSVLLER